jgi:lipopolysaccharide export system protein LptA
MLNNNTYSSLLAFLCVCLFVAAPTTVLAADEDREQPLVINAGRASIDDLKGVTTYRDKVRVKQGSMQIDADSLIITYEEDGEGERTITLVTAEGKPVSFQQRGANDSIIKANAERIEFYLQKDMLHLIGKARVEQDKDSFSGDYMIYDVKRSILTADGGKEGVTVTLQPRKNLSAGGKP